MRRRTGPFGADLTTSTPLEPLMGDGMFRHFRPIFKGTLIANVQMDAERGNRLIAEGLADLVAFGQPNGKRSLENQETCHV